MWNNSTRISVWYFVILMNLDYAPLWLLHYHLTKNACLVCNLSSVFKTFLKESLFTALIDNVLSDKTKCMSSWHKTEINVLYVTQDRDCTAVIWCMKMVCNRLLLLNNWCEIVYNIWLWGGDWFKYVLLKKISN